MTHLLHPVPAEVAVGDPLSVTITTDRGERLAPELGSFQAAARLTFERNRLLPVPADVHQANVPSQLSLAGDQTPVRDQLGRAHCWAFAALAALEAAYKRQYGSALDLSEQYFAHVCRATSLSGDYATSNVSIESAHSLWGGGGNSGSIGSLMTWWVPTEDLAPYQDEPVLEQLAASLGVLQIKDWPPAPGTTQEMIDAFEWDDRLVPRQARWHCTYGVTGVAGLSDRTVAAIKQVIASRREVVVDLATHYTLDASGRWVYQQNPDAGAHVFVVVGYDDHDQDGTFLVKNSWGGTALTRVAYSFFEHSDAFFGGSYITGIVAPGATPQRLAFWLGRWNQDHDGWRGTNLVRRFTDSSRPTKLGNYYHSDGSRYDVNGWMEQDGLHARFWISDQPGHITPGSQTGQPFNSWVFNWDPPSSAGTTVWSGTPYGVQLSRDPITSTTASSFSRDLWLGTWQMDHDGWRGTLAITGFGSPDLFGQHLSVDASYTPDGGSPLPTTAYLWVTAQHHLTMRISFPGGNDQPFDVFHHTWETDLFSGVTSWNNQTFGVKAHRNPPKGKEKEKDKEHKDGKDHKEKDVAKDRKDGMLEKLADQLHQMIAQPPGDVDPAPDLPRGQTAFIRPADRPDVM